MGNKYLSGYDSNGNLLQETAIDASTGAPDAGELIQTDASGKLDASFLPTGTGQDIVILEAFENLSAGDFVNIFDDSGTTKCRLADASTAGKEAFGFVLSSFTLGNNASIYMRGQNTQLTGLSGGTIYYLDTSTPGGVTSTQPSSSGNVVQVIGPANSATNISFDRTVSVTLS